MADTPSNDSGQTLSFDGMLAKAQMGELDNKVTLFKNLVNEQKNVSEQQQQNFEGYQNQFNTITSNLNESDKGLLAKIIDALRGNFSSTQTQIERYSPKPQTPEIPNDAQQNMPAPNDAQAGLNASPTDDKDAWIDETIADMDRQADERVSTELPTIDEGDEELDIDEQTLTNGDQLLQTDTEQQAVDPITPEAVTLQVDVPEAIVQPEPEAQNDLVASGLVDIDLSDEAELQAPSISISPEDVAPQNNTNILTSPDLGKLDTIVEEDEADLEAENQVKVEVDPSHVPLPDGKDNLTSPEVGKQDTIIKEDDVDLEGIDQLFKDEEQPKPEVDDNAPQAKTTLTPSPELGQPLASIPEGEEPEDDDFDLGDDQDLRGRVTNGYDSDNNSDEINLAQAPEDTDDDEPDANAATNVNTGPTPGLELDDEEDVELTQDEQEEPEVVNADTNTNTGPTPELVLDDKEEDEELDDEPEEDEPKPDEEEDAELEMNEKDEPEAEEQDEELDSELEGDGPDITTVAKLAGKEIKKKLDDDKPEEPAPQTKKQQPPKPTPGEGKKKEEKPEEPQKKKQGPEKENREHDSLSIAGLIANLIHAVGNLKKAGKEDVQNIKDVGNSILEKGKNLLGLGGSKGGGGAPAPSRQSPAPVASIEEPAPDSSSLAPPLKQGEDNLVVQQASMTPDGPNPDTAMLPQKSANDAISPTLKELAKNAVGLDADVELEADNENDNDSRARPGH